MLSFILVNQKKNQVPTLRTMVVYMFFSFLQLAIRSRDLSQAEKERTNGRAEQIHKMTTILTQNGQ